jgi:3-deoxy-D-manno-octulosonic acid kinase
VTLPPGFVRVRSGAWTLVVAAETREWLVPLLLAAPTGWRGYGCEPLAGGRGGTSLLRGTPRAVVVRPYRRGGLPARCVRDTYFGCTPRPFRELRVTETLRQRGAPVPLVLGGAVRWLAPACYRAWLATEYVPDAHSLWQWAAEHGGAMPAAVFAAVGRAIRCLHDAGGRHPDLNLHNILIRPAADASLVPGVLFLDFDRARLGLSRFHPVTAELDRLIRSARKLDPTGQYVTDAHLRALRAAYAEGA